MMALSMLLASASSFVTVPLRTSAVVQPATRAAVSNVNMFNLFGNTGTSSGRK